MGVKISVAAMVLTALAISLTGCYLGGEVPSGSTFADDGSTEPVSRSLPDDCARKSGSGVPQLCAILEGSERADYAQDFHQRLRVINPLSTSATNVIATLELPPGLALVSADPPATVTEPASWHWAQIRPGETQEVQLVLRGTGPGADLPTLLWSVTCGRPKPR